MRLIVHHIQSARWFRAVNRLRRAGKRVMSTLVLWGTAVWGRWRARQRMTDVALLARIKGDWDSVAALLDHMADRPNVSFVLPHVSAEQTAEFLRQRYAQHVSDVLEMADAVSRNELTLLGHSVHYPDGIDWHSEPLSGWRWPVWYRSRMYRYLWSGSRAADFILTWELNRHQHFVALGMAYWLTGDPRYVQVFIAHLQSWIEANPLQHGINWLGGQEMSCRLIAWTLAFQFFRGSSLFREQVGAAFFKSLFQQVDFLSSHLTTSKDVPNNHLIAELTALAVVGAVFPEFREAATWCETGLRLLCEQTSAQTHADGVNKEQAAGYHRFVTEFLLLVVALSRRGMLSRTPVIEETLEQMLEYMFYTLTPTARAPMWGDSVNYSAFRLDWSGAYWDFRPFLAAGAALFGRGDWKRAAGRFDAPSFWLLGPDGLAAWDALDVHPPEKTSRAFAEGGMYIIRDRWADDTDLAFVRCGPFGLGVTGHCAHAHCDLLSVVLWIAGRPLLTDSGTYTYHGPWRDIFRSTAAHNTLMIDGHEQAIPLNEYAWKQVPQAECLAWDERHVLAGMHTTSGLWHQRQVRHRQAGVWEITDRLEGQGRHTLTWFFHFAPSLSLQESDSDRYLLLNQQSNPYALVLPPPGVHVEVRIGWYSSRYRHKERNALLVANWRGEMPQKGLDFGWTFQQVGIQVATDIEASASGSESYFSTTYKGQ